MSFRKGHRRQRTETDILSACGIEHLRLPTPPYPSNPLFAPHCPSTPPTPDSAPSVLIECVDLRGSLQSPAAWEPPVKPLLDMDILTFAISSLSLPQPKKLSVSYDESRLKANPVERRSRAKDAYTAAIEARERSRTPPRRISASLSPAIRYRSLSAV